MLWSHALPYHRSELLLQPAERPQAIVARERGHLTRSGRMRAGRPRSQEPAANFWDAVLAGALFKGIVQAVLQIGAGHNPTHISPKMHNRLGNLGADASEDNARPE